MKTRHAAAMLALSCLLAWPAAAQETAKAEMKDKEGKSVGTVQLTQTPHGVLLRLELTGVPAGTRAFHIHEIGKCEPPFTSAGGHFNPEKKKHGLLAADGPHAGDMPNLHIPQGGRLTVEVLNPRVTLAKGQPNSLIREGGTALVIHEGVDDYKSDPTGEAGGRYACGVIQ